MVLVVGKGNSKLTLDKNENFETDNCAKVLMIIVQVLSFAEISSYLLLWFSLLIFLVCI